MPNVASNDPTLLLPRVRLLPDTSLLPDTCLLPLP
jgi:hypothetical protein